MRLHCRTVTKKFGSKQGRITWHMAIGSFLMLKILKIYQVIRTFTLLWYHQSFPSIIFKSIIITSACCPGLSILPHSWHLRHSLWKSNPILCLRSAKKWKAFNNFSYILIICQWMMMQLTEVDWLGAQFANPHCFCEGSSTGVIYRCVDVCNFMSVPSLQKYDLFPTLHWIT